MEHLTDAGDLVPNWFGFRRRNQLQPRSQFEFRVELRLGSQRYVDVVPKYLSAATVALRDIGGTDTAQRRI